MSRSPRTQPVYPWYATPLPPSPLAKNGNSSRPQHLQKKPDENPIIRNFFLVISSELHVLTHNLNNCSTGTNLSWMQWCWITEWSHWITNYYNCINGLDRLPDVSVRVTNNPPGWSRSPRAVKANQRDKPACEQARNEYGKKNQRAKRTEDEDQWIIRRAKRSGRREVREVGVCSVALPVGTTSNKECRLFGGF